MPWEHEHQRDSAIGRLPPTVLETEASYLQAANPLGSLPACNYHPPRSGHCEKAGLPE